MNGFMGKILVVDLTAKDYEILTKNTDYYKKFLGGSFLAAKLFKEQVGNNRNISPFSADNPIVFATGVLAGGSVCGPTRVNVLSLSPNNVSKSFVDSLGSRSIKQRTISPPRTLSG